MLAIFVNACLRHNFIPQIIINTVLIPIVKNKLKPATESDNYRPIAIATAMSKIFELIVLNKCEHQLSTTPNQFGFKKDHSTELCIYSLKEVINYYNSNGSPVFVCFLDISKAFDRVNFHKLFSKMLQKSVPVYIVKLIAFWYTKQNLMIRWGNKYSDPFTVCNGIKQGGLLSPYLFNLYIDNLSKQLNRTGVGCLAGVQLINHLSYADDMVLLAPSKRALQMLLDVCSNYAIVFDIIYNTEKSFCMVCWPKKFLFQFYPMFYLQNVLLEYVEIFKYLGVLITNTVSDDDEINARMRGIYATGNMLIRKFGQCDLSCKLLMFKTFFSNVYACGLWTNYKVASFSKVKVSHNDIFRNLLDVPRWESASMLFAEHRVCNLDSVIRNSYYSLMSRVINSTNPLIASLVQSGVRRHSRLWHRWSVALGRDLVVNM